MTQIRNVTVLVDWNSQLHVLGLSQHKLQQWFLSRVFERLLRRSINALDALGVVGPFKITFRLYYGWIKGFEEQISRKQLRTFLASNEFVIAVNSPRAIVARVEFGDHLLSGKASRVHRKLGVHLPNTLRNGIGANKPPYEKMVDTALVSDLMVWACKAMSEGLLVCDANVLLVLAEDDDFWPSMIAAEPLWENWGGKACVIQKNPPAENMPDVSGLMLKM